MRLRNSTKKYGNNLKVKIGELQDEVIHLKSQIATYIVAGQMVRDNSNNNLTTESRKPYILLIGTSNIEGIDEMRLSSEADVHKVVQYTLEDTARFLDTAPESRKFGSSSFADQ